MNFGECFISVTLVVIVLICHRHEHLYVHIRSNIIISDEFIDKSIMSQLYGCPVVLCTLSMLSSPKLHQFGVFRKVPLKNIVVDEASQIEIGEYIPLFTTTSTIRKVTFIGDDKQCKSQLY